ncbi:MAG: diguanylate cyclase [Halopseudomonas sp.]
MNERRETVLVVDDKPYNLHLLIEVLSDSYEILVATSGAEAIKRVHSDTPPDLILLDIVMPEMDGLQVCRKLKGDAATSHIPVIFVTAKGDIADETEGLAVGAVDYISKPISPAIVLARVKTHLKLKAQTDLLTRLSIQDQLTQLPNRRHFDKCLDDEWRRHMRTSCAFSIVMMDVDHFKQYNDNYGHYAGDECLQQVASALNSVVQRAAEVVARFGGEEFVALLPMTDNAAAMEMGNRFRQQVEALGLKHEHSSTGDCVTISIGVATCIPKEHTDPRLLLETADRMLYDAKKKARNCVVGGTLNKDENLVRSE